MTTPTSKRGRQAPPPEFRVSDEAYCKALDSLRRKAENPLKPLPMPESVPDPDLATVEAYTQERIFYWRANKTIRLFFGEDFLIDLNQLITRAQLLDLVVTLLAKSWMDARRVRAVALRIAALKGWRLTGS